MIEKRFIVVDHSTCVFDKITKEEYVCIDKEEAILVCKRLNNQQYIIEQLQKENKNLKKWKKRIIEYLTDWFNKTEYLSVLYKINEINNEIGLDNDE